ncbi:MAG: hypothetical protein V7707_19625 [Motiliproteus sp.]
MAVQSQILSLAGAQDSKIGVRFRVSGELGRLPCSQTPGDRFGPTPAAESNVSY